MWYTLTFFLDMVVVMHLQHQVLDGCVATDLETHSLGQLQVGRVVRPGVQDLLTALAHRTRLDGRVVARVHLAAAVPHTLLTARLAAPEQQHMVGDVGVVGQKSNC